MTRREEFDREVCAVVEQIPAGRVATYGEIARLIGFPAHARRVGRALSAAPGGLPCHRVVDASGRTAPGWAAQRTLLEAEGVGFKRNGRVDLARCGWEVLRAEPAPPVPCDRVRRGGNNPVPATVSSPNER